MFSRIRFIQTLTVALTAGLALAGSAAEPSGDRYIVSFLDDAEGRAALMRSGATIALDLPGQGAAAAHIPAKALNGLARNPHIEYIEADPIRRPMAQTTPWGIPAIQADIIESTETTGTINVCVIDSGYASGHEDLPAATRAGASTDGDLCNHGTHVAGTIVALNNDHGVVGVAPGNVAIHAVKVFGGTSCSWTYASTLISALDLCTSVGADVVNMSLGGPVKSRTEDRAFRAADNNGVLSVAAAGNGGNTQKSYPASYGSVVSVAAVDSALNVASFSQQNSSVELAAPGVAVRSTVPMGAGFEESLVVDGSAFEATAMEGSPDVTNATGDLFRCNAVDGLGSPGDCNGAAGKVCLIERGSLTFADKVLECEDQGGLAAVIFNSAPSLFSGTLGGVATNIPSVGVSGADGATLASLAAPTATVTTTEGHYAFWDGTSMATPHVAGAAALVWSHDTSCSNNEVRNALTSTARDLGADGRDNAYGFGLVQAADALAALSCGGDISEPGGGTCTLLAKGTSCSTDAECCSGACKGKPGEKTCK